MVICWERTVSLAFHVCCFYFIAVLITGVTFPLGVCGRIWNQIVSVPDHCFFIYVAALFGLFEVWWLGAVCTGLYEGNACLFPCYCGPNS